MFASFVIFRWVFCAVVTDAPLTAPSSAPSNSPSTTPTFSPSTYPTSTPSNQPTQPPTLSPFLSPSQSPSQPPSVAPTVSPTDFPSSVPTSSPSATPTRIPSASPSFAPSAIPSQVPSNAPSYTPTAAPTSAPTDTVCDDVVQTVDTFAVCTFLKPIWGGEIMFHIMQRDYCNETFTPFQLVECNGLNEIVNISIADHGASVSGRITSEMIQSLPNSVKKLNLSNNNLYGEIDFWDKIHRFEEVDISNCSFEGKVEIDSIFSSTESQLRKLYINSNQWDEQSISWYMLCFEYPNLIELDLSNNKFVGMIDLDWYNNCSLSYLNVANNEFSGIRRLEDQLTLEELYISNNLINQEMDISELPKNLRIFECYDNEFSGTVMMDEIPDTLEIFNCGYNSFDELNWTVVDEIASNNLKQLSMFDVLILHGFENELMTTHSIQFDDFFSFHMFVY